MEKKFVEYWSKRRAKGRLSYSITNAAVLSLAIASFYYLIRYFFDNKVPDVLEFILFTGILFIINGLLNYFYDWRKNEAQYKKKNQEFD